MIEEQGDPREGNYGDQFVVVTYRPDDPPSAPDSIANRDVGWADRAAVYDLGRPRQRRSEEDERDAVFGRRVGVAGGALLHALRGRGGGDDRPEATARR
ncbi:hypothetical protein BRD03_10125 [Halobacteriales archaeon QS_9_68_17]|nr:MAG: hypothetical protein BRD03_10125 [Halobacteriales archaeon QS_9_68_17]